MQNKTHKKKAQRIPADSYENQAESVYFTSWMYNSQVASSSLSDLSNDGRLPSPGIETLSTSAPWIAVASVAASWEIAEPGEHALCNPHFAQALCKFVSSWRAERSIDAALLQLESPDRPQASNNLECHSGMGLALRTGRGGQRLRNGWKLAI